MARPDAVVFIYISTFAADAKSAYPSQTTALKNSLSSLETAIKSAKGQTPLAAAAAVVPAVTQVQTSAATCRTPPQANASEGVGHAGPGVTLAQR